MKLHINESPEFFWEMANVRGKNVKVPHKLDFSFVFTTKDCTEGKDLYHGIRVKPVFNPERINTEDIGTLKLFGDWEYIPGKNDIHINRKQIKEMINFFKEYRILFAAVWEKMLPQDTLQEYFRGIVDFEELKQEFYFYNEYEKELDKITTLNSLEEFVNNYNIFNTWNT